MEKRKYLLMHSAGGCHVIDLAVYQFGSDVLREIVVVFFCVNARGISDGRKKIGYMNFFVSHSVQV